MRATFYLTVAVATLFINFSDARSLNKRSGSDAVTELLGSALDTGDILGSVTELTDAVVSPAAIKDQQQKKKKRDLPIVDGLFDDLLKKRNTGFPETEETKDETIVVINADD